MLDTLEWLRRETDVWFEVTNLVIPRANDSNDELRSMCDWMLDRLGDQTPVHFTAFHPDFRMLDRPRTPVETLLIAREIAISQGLKYVYVGNVDDETHQSTYCGNCGEMLIQRNWYELGPLSPQRKSMQFLQRHRPRTLRRGAPATGAASGNPYESPNSRATRQRTPPEVESAGAVASSEPRSGKTMTDLEQGLDLDERQQQAVHAAAAELLSAAVVGRSPHLTDASLAGAAALPVLGAYVSVKRQGRLRACCGFMGQSVPLAEALKTAAARSATEDPRLPRISPSELAWLDLETWLLSGMRPVTARGEERQDAVEIGRHGLQISRGNSAGLLLPGVATEQGLNSTGFLEHVCMKAGLPPTAWKEDDVQLFTFEGASISGRIDAARNDADPAGKLLTDEEVFESCFDRAATTSARFLIGAMPSYYIPGCSDGMVAGAAITFRMPDEAQPSSVSRLSFRPGLPMQSTLYSLAETAAKLLAARSIDSGGVADLQPQLTLLYDTAMHGTLAEPDLGGFSADERALLVVQGNSVGVEVRFRAHAGRPRR